MSIIMSQSKAKQLGKPYNWIFPWQYDKSKFYCSSLAWRAWDKVEDSLFAGFDIDGTINPSVMPEAIYFDFNMTNERGLLYNKLVKKAFWNPFD